MLVCLMCSASAGAQTESLVVSGSLKHEDTKAKLDNVTVSVTRDGEAFDQIQVDRNGKYFLDLPLRHNYVISFSADGMVSKCVAIQSANTPEDQLNDGFMFDLDMSLFDSVEGFDETILETPIGIASFDERSGRIQFDLDHTNDMRRQIDAEFDRLAELADDLERAQMRYDNAMEDAGRAEARERWGDAKDEYEKALNFKPGDSAAQAGLDRANSKLAAARRAEEEAAAAEAAAAAAEEAARQAEADAARAAEEEAARAGREAQEAAEAAQRAEEAAARAAEQAQAQREAEERLAEAQAEEEARAARERDSAAQADRESQAQAEREAEAQRQAARDADAARRQADLDAASAEQQAQLEAERLEREAREKEWEERQAAREAEQDARKAQAQARAQNLSQRSGKAEDEAEAYYRQALESERQAMAAEVQDTKDEVAMQQERWNAEASDRARDERRQVLSLEDGTGSASRPSGQERDRMVGDVEEAQRAREQRAQQVYELRRREAESLHEVASGTRGTTGRQVGNEYQGREEEHRRARAAQLEEIEAMKRSDELMKTRSAARLKNGAQGALLDLDMTVEASKERGVPALLSPEDRDIPQGVQETSYDIQNGLVIMRTVRAGDVVQRYRKVVMKTGTYYFCGDKSITKTRWELETNLSYD
jgi:chemotaxis protein histidine kinase CheA